jgi:UTP--glucose-1-phosphate uridylyltransferase
LRKKGKDDLLETLKSTNMDSGRDRLYPPAQGAGPRPRGLVRARLMSNEPFAVILPDDVIAAETPCLQQMVEAYSDLGGNMVAAMEVAPDKAPRKYGILDVKEDMGAGVGQGDGGKAAADVRHPRTLP